MNKVNENGKNKLTMSQLKNLINESESSQEELIDTKRRQVEVAKDRVKLLQDVLVKVQDELDKVATAIDSGEIDGSKDNYHIKAPDEFKETFTELRQFVVDISDLRKDANDALMNLCFGFDNNLRGVIKSRVPEYDPVY